MIRIQINAELNNNAVYGNTMTGIIEIEEDELEDLDPAERSRVISALVEEHVLANMAGWDWKEIKEEEPRCQVRIEDGGVYGEEVLICSLKPHDGTEHYDSRRSLWWDSETKARVSGIRHGELRRKYNQVT